MEQEQVVAQLGRATLVTGEVLLKGLFLVCSKAVEIYQFKGENTHFTGEADWNKFMATADTKEVHYKMKSISRRFGKNSANTGLAFLFIPTRTVRQLSLSTLKIRGL